MFLHECVRKWHGVTAPLCRLSAGKLVALLTTVVENFRGELLFRCLVIQTEQIEGVEMEQEKQEAADDELEERFRGSCKYLQQRSLRIFSIDLGEQFTGVLEENESEIYKAI